MKESFGKWGSQVLLGRQATHNLPPAAISLPRFVALVAMGRMRVDSPLIGCSRDLGLGSLVDSCRKDLGGTHEERQRIVGRMMNSRPAKTDQEHIEDAARSLEDYCSVRPEEC